MAASAKGIRAGKAYVELFADSSRLARGLKSAEAKLNAFGQSVRQMGRQLAALGAAITAPLLASGKVFASFETQMKMVSTMLDKSDEHMQKFSEGIRKLSVEFGESTAVLAKGLYDLLSASVDPAKALDVLAVAAKAAKGGMTDTAVAVDGITSLLNAFQMSADKAGYVADVMFQTVKRGKLTFPELAANLGKVAPMAQAAGLSMEDMAAAIATMTRQGLSAEEATTRLVGILKAAPEQAGNIAALIEKYVGQDLSQIMVDFPEVRAAGGIAALAADMEGFQRDLMLMRDASGRADEAFARMMGGLGEAFNQAKAAVADLMVSIGDALAPTLKRVGEQIVRITSMVSDWVKAHKALIVIAFAVGAGLVAAGAAMITFSLAISLASKAVGVLMIAVKAAHLTMTALTIAFAAITSPITLVVAALAGLAAYLLYTSGVGEKALGWLGNRFGALKDDALAAYGGITDALASGDIGLAVRILWLTLKMEFIKGLNVIRELWNNVWYGLLATTEIVWHGLEVAWIETTAFMSQLWNDLGYAILATWNAVGKSLAKAWHWLKGLLDSTFDVDAANAATEQYYAMADAIAAAQYVDASAARERERRQSRAGSAGEYERTMGQLSDDYSRAAAASKVDLAKAQADWQAALAAARAKRTATETTTGGEMGPLPSLPSMAAVQASVASVKQRTTGAAGTFNAAAILGLQAGGAQDKIADATSRTAKSVEGLRADLRARELEFD